MDEVSACPRCGDRVRPICRSCTHHPISVRVQAPSKERLEAAAALVEKGWSVKRAAHAYRVMKGDLQDHVDWIFSD
jgi:hypothetical protein